MRAVSRTRRRRDPGIDHAHRTVGDDDRDVVVALFGEPHRFSEQRQWEAFGRG